MVGSGAWLLVGPGGSVVRYSDEVGVGSNTLDVSISKEVESGTGASLQQVHNRQYQ